jgi:adenylate cyclase, class 2
MDTKEREIKFYIQDLAGLADRLRVCGADLSRKRMLERNLRLDTEDHSLKKEDRLLRIRQDDQVRVTYKDKAQVEDGVITRTELEFVSDDYAITKKFFEALDYQVVVIYEKYRQEYRLGDVKVMLDELPYGDFLEIEAPNIALIDGVGQMLGLDRSRGIENNYLGLFEILMQDKGLTFRDLTFENFEGLSISATDLKVQPADAQGG